MQDKKVPVKVGKGGVFRIDAKTFTLVYGGRESGSFLDWGAKGGYHGEFWMGRKGLDWLVGGL